MVSYLRVTITVPAARRYTSRYAASTMYSTSHPVTRGVLERLGLTG